jgi:hypothetical protein
MMNVEQSVEWELAGETEILGENLPQPHFVHHKTHMSWDRTRAAAVWSQRLTAWAMARPCYCVSLQLPAFEPIVRYKNLYEHYIIRPHSNFLLLTEQVRLAVTL